MSLALPRSQLVAAARRGSVCRRVDPILMLFSNISGTSRASKTGSGRQATARSSFSDARRQRTGARWVRADNAFQRSPRQILMHNFRQLPLPARQAGLRPDNAVVVHRSENVRLGGRGWTFWEAPVIGKRACHFAIDAAFRVAEFVRIPTRHQVCQEFSRIPLQKIACRSLHVMHESAIRAPGARQPPPPAPGDINVLRNCQRTSAGQVFQPVFQPWRWSSPSTPLSRAQAIS